MIWGQVLVLLVMIMCCKLYCGWWGQTLTLHTMHCAQATMLHRGFRSAKKNGVEVNEEQVIPFFVIIIGQEICDFFFYLDLRQLVNLPYLDRDLSFTTSWMILEKKGTLQTWQTPQVQRLLDNSRRLQSDIIGALSLKQQQNLNKTGLTTF